jgi:hypothetical protein
LFRTKVVVRERRSCIFFLVSCVVVCIFAVDKVERTKENKTKTE